MDFTGGQVFDSKLVFITCISLIKLNGFAQHFQYGFPILFHPSCHNRFIAFIVFPFLTGRMVATTAETARKECIVRVNPPLSRCEHPAVN